MVLRDGGRRRFGRRGCGRRRRGRCGGGRIVCRSLRVAVLLRREAEGLEGDAAFDRVGLAAGDRGQHDARAPGAEAQVGSGHAVRVLLGVQHVQPSGVVDRVIARDVQATLGIPSHQVGDGIQESGDRGAVAGCGDQGTGAVLPLGAQLTVPQGQHVLAGLLVDMPRGDGDVAEQRGVRRAPTLPQAVEGVVDVIHEIAADALVEAALLTAQPVAQLLGKGAVVVGVLRGGHLQGELRVLHREEPRGAGDPVQLDAAAVGLLEQVPVHLRGGLPRSHDRDRPRLQQALARGQELRGVDDGAGAFAGLFAQHAERLGQHRSGADAEHHMAAAMLLEAHHGAVLVEHLCGDHEVLVRADGADRADGFDGFDGGARARRRSVVGRSSTLGVLSRLHGDHPAAPAQRIQLVRNPAAVRVVLRAQRIERFADVERVEPPGGLEERQERIARGGIGHRHQVREEGNLDRGAVEHHPRMPAELGALVQEHRVDVLERVRERGQTQPERADADAHQVMDRPPVRCRGGRRDRRGAEAAEAAEAAELSAVVPSAGLIVHLPRRPERNPSHGRRSLGRTRPRGSRGRRGRSRPAVRGPWRAPGPARRRCPARWPRDSAA